MTTFNHNAALAHPLPESHSKPSGQEYINYAHAQKQNAVQESDVFFLSADEKMAGIKDVISQISNTNVPILITGESGTGKEVIARMIHSSSSRKDKPFVAINCAAIPPSLLESELFGHEKGAFTGAHARHVGKFEQASGGTLLLDEVTEIDPILQAKLLRALQEREIERIGGSGPVSIDTRIIATSNRDMAASVAKGEFRQDLYYRLYVIHLKVPALRERPKDIMLLAQHYLNHYAQQFSRGAVQFSQEAANRLINYSWPGNVRELQNVMQRAILMSKGSMIRGDEIPLDSPRSAEIQDWVRTLPIGRSMHEVETRFIIETLRRHGGNRTHAAKTLGISLRTLRNKINEYSALGIDVPAAPTGKAL